MMAALPGNVSYCTVAGKFITFAGDGNDVDRFPEAVPLEGLTLKFKPSVATVVNETASPPVTIVTAEITATTDPQGVVLGPDGTPTLMLVASDDPDLKPHNWTWNVVVSGGGIKAMSFDFVAPSGGTVDLATVVPVPPSPGSQVSAWQSVVLTVTNVRDETVAAYEATLAAIEDFEPGTGGGGLDEAAVQDIVDTALTSKADDSAVVKLTGAQTVAGVKTFSAAPLVPDNAFAQAKVVGLVAALADKIASTGAQSIAGVKTFTDPPVVPTQAPGDNTQKAASTAFVVAAVAALVNSAPALLNTLDELAQALGDDPAFATTITNALSLKAPLASPVFTGNPTAPTPAAGDNDQSVATTAFVQAAVTAVAGVASQVWVVQWDGDEWVDPTPPGGSAVKIRIFDPMGHTDAPLYTGATLPGVTDYYGFDS